MTALSPQDQAVVNHRAWRDRLSAALGTTRPLAQIPDGYLSKARRHWTHHTTTGRHPDAWMWATVIGAEIERRHARGTRQEYAA